VLPPSHDRHNLAWLGVLVHFGRTLDAESKAFVDDAIPAIDTNWSEEQFDCGFQGNWSSKHRDKAWLEMSKLSKRDLAALQGSWEQIDLEADGISNPPDDLSPPGALTTFSGNHFAIHTAEGVLLLEGTFTLDASASPKAINYIDSMGPDLGKQLPAIYKLEGDLFVFVAAEEGAPRPTSFRTGPGQTMRSFRRR
jgi:uncharacterized protein (TIGR03067 family)